MRHPMHSISKGFFGAALLAALAACGSGLNSSSGSTGTSGGSKAVFLGSGSGTSFKNGVVDLAATSLSAGGSTSVTVNIQTGDGNAYTGTIAVTFISPCFQSGLASFTVSGSTTPTNVVTTSNGQAVITYSATGCSGTDTITATATNPNGSNILSASATLSVAAATLGSIQWVSTSNNSQIALAGSGGLETATISFKVTDTTGGPVPNQKVTFTLETSTGGITITPTTAVSGTDGLVATVMHAGTEHGSARVKASTVRSGTTISTVSPGIVVSTGIPTQDRFSLALTVHNVEGWSIDGNTSVLTVRMADRFGNPVAVGTTVSFTANGGHIEPSCTTTDPSTGACQVTWTSADPRPQGPTSAPASVTGHAEILAYTTGEEHFDDVNGDGVFDHTDVFTSGTTSDDIFSWLRDPTIDDIGEVYLDENENGKFDSGEFFFNFDNNSTRHAPNGKYHGAGCLGTASVSCDSSSTLGIGLQDCIIMSTGGVFIVPDDGGTSTSPAGNHQPQGSSRVYDVYDAFGNAPPKGMTFTTVTNGTTATLVNNTVPDIGCASSPPGLFTDANDSINTPAQKIGGGSYQITVTVPGTAQPGSFVIQAVSPGGVPSSSETVNVP